MEIFSSDCFTLVQIFCESHTTSIPKRSWNSFSLIRWTFASFNPLIALLFRLRGVILNLRFVNSVEQRLEDPDTSEKCSFERVSGQRLTNAVAIALTVFSYSNVHINVDTTYWYLANLSRLAHFQSVIFQYQHFDFFMILSQRLVGIQNDNSKWRFGSTSILLPAFQFENIVKIQFLPGLYLL